MNLDDLKTALRGMMGEVETGAVDLGGGRWRVSFPSGRSCVVSTVGGYVEDPVMAREPFLALCADSGGFDEQTAVTKMAAFLGVSEGETRARMALVCITILGAGDGM